MWKGARDRGLPGARAPAGVEAGRRRRRPLNVCMLAKGASSRTHVAWTPAVLSGRGLQFFPCGHQHSTTFRGLQTSFSARSLPRIPNRPHHQFQVTRAVDTWCGATYSAPSLEKARRQACSRNSSGFGTGIARVRFPVFQKRSDDCTSSCTPIAAPVEPNAL